jgi:hypothetical protein
VVGDGENHNMAKWEREAIPIDAFGVLRQGRDQIRPKWENEAVLVSPQVERPLKRTQGAFRGAGATGGWTEEGLAMRGLKQFANILPETAKEVMYGLGGGKISSFVTAGLLNRRLRKMGIKAPSLRETQKLVKQRVLKGTKIPELEIAPPTTIGEKAVDITAGIGKFVTKLVILRKVMPGAQEAALWEMENISSGGIPGLGYAMHGAFSAPGKVIKGVKLPTKAGRLAAESVALASVSALEQKIDTGEIDPVQVGIAAALPLALRTPKAIKVLIRKRNPKVMKAIAEVTVPAKVSPVDAANKVVTDWSTKAKLLNKTERKAAVHKLHQRQAGMVKETYKRLRTEGVPRLTAGARALKAGKGLKAKNPEIEPLVLNEAQRDVYGKKIDQVYPEGLEFQHGSASKAILKMTEGRIPTNYEFGLLEPIFGRDATKKLFGELIKKRLFSGWELPALTIQAFKSKFGLDIQMFRQGRSLAVRHPVLYLKSSWVNARAMVQNKYAERMYTRVRNSQGYAHSEKIGYNYVGEAGYSSKRLEYYALGLTERLLVSKSKILRGWGRLLAAGERGAVAGINNMQKGLYDNSMKQVRNLNLTAAQEKLWLVNRAKTHNTFMKILRVPPGKEYQGLRRLKQAANYILFSPSMTAGRPLSIKAMVANKGSRKYAAGVIARNIASIYALTTIPTIIGHQMRLQNPTEEPDVNGELNVLDGNWGKIRYGDTVFDPSGGDAPFYRTIARIGVSAYMQGREKITGEVTTEFAGKRIPDAGETLERYFTTRETAAIGYAKTMLTGKDWLGEPIPRLEATVRALSPEILEATIETGMADGLWESLATMVMTTTSVGVSTYPVRAAATRSKFRDIVSQTKHGKDWDELSMREQNRLRSEHRKQFEVLSERIRKEKVDKPSYREKSEEEELRASKRVKGLLSKPNRQWVDDISLRVSRWPKNWYLNDKRYNRYQQLVAQFVDERLSRIDFTGMDERRRIARVQVIVKVAKNKALGTLRRETRR